MQGYESSPAHRSNQSLSLPTGAQPIPVGGPRQIRRMTVGSQSSLSLPDGGRQPSPRPPSPLRNSFTMSSSTGIDPDEVDSEDDSEDEERSRRPRNWRRSPSPAPSVTNLAASFVQRVNNFVGGIAPKSPGMPSDAELEAEAERERERSRREAEAILTREAQQRQQVEDRVLAMMDNTRGLPPPPSSRSNTVPTTPSPSSSHKEGGNWWQAAKNRLTPTKDKEPTTPVTPAQQIILDAKAKEKDPPPTANLNIPLPPPTRKPVPASPSSPTPSRPSLSTPNLSPSPMRQADSLANSPSREAPPVYVQFTPQGTVDVPVTLLAIAKRFEKLEKWTIGHVRALEDRMNDVERWLVDKENLKEEEGKSGPSSTSNVAQQELSEIRDEVSELQGRVGELGREMAKLAIAPSNLSSGPKAQVAAVNLAHPRQTSNTAQVHESVEAPVAEVFSTPRHARILSSARESTSPPLAGPNRTPSGTRLPYPTGDYNSPQDAFSPTGSPNASINSAKRGKVSGLPQVSGSPISSVFNLASTLTARPLSPPSTLPTGGISASRNAASTPTAAAAAVSTTPSRTASPMSSAKTPNSGNTGLPPPRSSSRPGSVSPTPRKRYTVALGGPIVAPPSPPDYQSNAAETSTTTARRAPGTPKNAPRNLFSEPGNSEYDDDARDEDDEDDELGGETIGKSASARYTRKLTVQKKKSNASMSSVGSVSSVDKDVLRSTPPSAALRRVGTDFRDGGIRQVPRQQQPAAAVQTVPSGNARRMKAQSVYGMSSFLPSSNTASTAPMNISTTNVSTAGAAAYGSLGTSPNTTAPLRFRSKSSEKLSLNSASATSSTSTSPSPFNNSPLTPNSATFVDPLLLRRKQEVAAATQGVSMASGSGSAVGGKGTRKMAVGQLVAFFDKDKDRRGRK